MFCYTSLPPSLPPSLLSPQIEKSKLKQGSRVALDMTTLTIMRQLPREVDPLVYNMSIEDPGDVDYSSVGGLSEQIRELREVRRMVRGEERRGVRGEGGGREGGRRGGGGRGGGWEVSIIYFIRTYMYM